MEFLPDPINDRPVKDLPPFVNKEIKDEMLFTINEEGNEVVDWRMFEEFMSKEGPITKRQVLKLL